MKSKANFKGHPLHPILVAFPIAFFTATFLFDLLSNWMAADVLQQAASLLGITGVVMALVAAVPGIIDYRFTVPPDSSAKQRAARHGLVNVAMVALFLFAWIIRDRESTDFRWILVLEGVGFVLLGIAGWLGGTLVFRNQIGVDLRYAHAGKWRESRLSSDGGRVAVARQDELKTDQMKLLHIAGKRIVLGKTADGYVAFDDRCPHRGGSLAGGMMIGGIVQCPWHGSQFECATGRVKAGPSTIGVATYPTVVDGGRVYVLL